MTDGSLDANVVLRLLLDDVPQQRASAQRLLESGVYRVNVVAVVEVAFVLARAYQLDRAKIATLLRAFLSLPQVVTRAYVSAALERFAASPKLSLEDCLLVEVAREDGDEPLWTFDRKLASQTDARLVGHTVGHG